MSEVKAWTHRSTHTQPCSRRIVGNLASWRWSLAPRGQKVLHSQLDQPEQRGQSQIVSTSRVYEYWHEQSENIGRGLNVTWYRRRGLCVTWYMGLDLSVSWHMGRGLSVSWHMGCGLSVTWHMGRGLSVACIRGVTWVSPCRGRDLCDAYYRGVAWVLPCIWGVVYLIPGIGGVVCVLPGIGVWPESCLAQGAWSVWYLV